MRGGENKEAGMMLLALEHLFNLIEISKQARSPMKSNIRISIPAEYKVYCSIVASSQKDIYDLIAVKGKKLAVFFYEY